MTREDIIERLQPLIEQLADEVIELAGEAATELLRQRLQGLLETPAVAVTSKPKKARAMKASKPAKGERKPMSCNKCGAVGFTSRTCGKTHNVEQASKPASSSLVVAKPPPQTADRIASLRSRRPPKPAAASDADDDELGLHKVISFSF